MPTKEPKYSKVQSDEHIDNIKHHDSDANPNESLMGHHIRDKSRDEGLEPSRRARQFRWCSSTLVQGLLNIVLFVALLGLLLDRRRPKTLEGSGDITGFIPPVGHQIKSFVPNMSFAPENGTEFFTDEVKNMWLSLVPTGLGYLKVDEPSKYKNLPHPIKGYSKTVFTTSVTHQLHCLYNIVEVYSSLTSGETIPTQMKGHLPHCFEYLRQSIMCCGDTALEGQHTTFPAGTIGSDGWDAKHVCKDYDAIYTFLEENRVDDSVWI